MDKRIQKSLKQYNLSLSQEAVSMILGALVVLLIGLLAYNYFRSRPTPTNLVSPVNDQVQIGSLTNPAAAVALPATHTVSVGENLWLIAEKYYASGYNYADIATANDLANPNNIDVGQKLTIPKVEPKATTVTSALTPAVVDNRIEGNSYIVSKGDNLWMIAVRAYGDGYKWVDLARANNLANPDLIFSGNVLSIPR